MKRRSFTAEQLRREITYDPMTGEVRWLITGQGRRSKPGEIAGGRSTSTGYMRICMFGHRYEAHVLIWLYMTDRWPAAEIDHIDGDHENDRWSNLREATHGQNMLNRGLHKSNKTGFHGLVPSGKRWGAKITIGRAQMWLGTFDTKEEAVQARKAAEKSLFGEFARAG